MYLCDRCKKEIVRGEEIVKSCEVARIDPLLEVTLTTTRGCHWHIACAIEHILEILERRKEIG